MILLGIIGGTSVVVEMLRYMGEPNNFADDMTDDRLQMMNASSTLELGLKTFIFDIIFVDLVVVILLLCMSKNTYMRIV